MLIHIRRSDNALDDSHTDPKRVFTATFEFPYIRSVLAHA